MNCGWSWSWLAVEVAVGAGRRGVEVPPLSSVRHRGGWPRWSRCHPWAPRLGEVVAAPVVGSAPRQLAGRPKWSAVRILGRRSRATVDPEPCSDVNGSTDEPFGGARIRPRPGSGRAPRSAGPPRILFVNRNGCLTAQPHATGARLRLRTRRSRRRGGMSPPETPLRAHRHDNDATPPRSKDAARAAPRT